MKHSKSLLSLLSLAIALLFSINTTAQHDHKSTKKDFTILVETTDNGIKMKCIRGCAWENLSFSINGRNAQSVDQFGTFNAESKRQIADPKHLDFEFSIARKNNAFVLHGLKGTNWQTLNIINSKNGQFFNKDGLLQVQ